MARLTHLDRRGETSMVDVSSKPVVLREAIAQGHIRLRPETLRLIESNAIAKGNGDEGCLKDEGYLKTTCPSAALPGNRDAGNASIVDSADKRNFLV